MTHVHQALVYRYRCSACRRTFRHYPDGITSARQSQRLIQFAALGWVLGLSLRGTTAILSVFPVALCHMSVWRDLQAQAVALQRRLPRRVRVLGVDGVYPKLRGQEQPTLVCVDLGTGQPVALGAVNERDWRAVVKWLEPLMNEHRGSNQSTSSSIHNERILSGSQGTRYCHCRPPPKLRSLSIRAQSRHSQIPSPLSPGQEDRGTAWPKPMGQQKPLADPLPLERPFCYNTPLMSPETISLATARNLLVTTQGLAQLPQRPAEKKDVLDVIRRMRMLQIDTIHVIARSPYLVLWSRLGDYTSAWLDELLAEGALFEYWSHALCFLPIEDYPLYRRFMLEVPRGWGDARAWLGERPELVERVMGRIRQEGGLRSADFQNDHKPAGGWWNWKDEKTALECLFVLGELMIARRQSFQRVYDLPSRVLPGWDDGPEAANVPSREDVLQTFTLRAVEALGVALADWVPDYYRQPKTGNAARLEALAADGLLRRVAIEGLPGPAYLHPAAAPAEQVSLTTVLSPFDPLVWDRKRLKDLFGFDYTIEVYTPAPKRRFGYFTLPILHRGELVGRLDPKAHRADGLFEVRAVALEPGVEPTDDLVEGLADALRRLAAWHGTPELVIRRSEPAGLAEWLLA